MNRHFHRELCRLLTPPNLLMVVVSIFVLSEQHAFAQQSDTGQQAVSWDFSARKGTDGNPVLVLHARIREGWKLYSTTNPDTLGYSRVTLDSGAHARIVRIEELGGVQKRRTLFSMEQKRVFLPVMHSGWSGCSPARGTGRARET